MKIDDQEVVDPPVDWPRLRPPQSREAFVEVLVILNGFLDVPLYPPSVMAWLRDVTGSKYSAVSFGRLIYEADPVWAVVDDLTHQEWLARMKSHAGFGAEVARLLARLTSRRNHRAQSGDTDDNLRDQSLVVRRSIKHYAALIWSDEMRGTPTPNGALTSATLLRVPSYRLATPAFGSSGIAFADAREEAVLAFERLSSRLFTNEPWSSTSEEAQEDAEEPDTEEEARVAEQITEMALDQDWASGETELDGEESEAATEEAQADRARKLFKSWATSTSKLAQHCRSLPALCKLVTALAHSQPQVASMSNERLAALICGGLVAFHGVPLRDALNVSISDAQEKVRLSGKGALAPGYLSITSYTIALGCDYSAALKGRFTEVQFLSLPLPAGLSAIVTELAGKAGGPATLRSFLGPKALDTVLQVFAEIMAVDIDDIRYLSLHRAYDYCALIDAAVPLPTVMILVGRPLCDWRAATNYMSAPYADLASTHLKILEALHQTAGVALSLNAAKLPPQVSVFGSPSPSWNDEISAFASLVKEANTQPKLLALVQFALKLLGARHRSLHIHPGGAYRPLPVPHLRFWDKTLSEDFARWIPAIPSLEKLIQMAFDLGARGRDMAYPCANGRRAIWSDLKEPEKLDLQSHARAEPEAKSIRRSLFSAMSAAGGGEVSLKNMLGHGLDQNLPSALHPIFSQGFLLRGNAKIFSSMLGATDFASALDELTDKLRAFPTATALPSKREVQIALGKREGLDIGSKQPSSRMDHQIFLAIVHGLRVLGASNQAGRSQRFTQSILAAELTLILGSEKAVRRMAPYCNGHCFVVPSRSPTDQPKPLILLAPIAQLGGQLGLLPLEIWRTDPEAALRICRAVERVQQQHLKKEISETSKGDHLAILAGLNLFSDYKFGKSQLGGTLKECFLLGKKAGIDVGAGREPTLKRIYEAFCRSASDCASEFLPNHFLASLAGTHLHPAEHFSIVDLLPASFPLQSINGTPWVDPTAPAPRRRESWESEGDFNRAAGAKDWVEGDFSEILTPGWQFMSGQVITGLARHMAGPSRSKIAKWILKNHVFLPREQARFWPKKWAEIKRKTVQLMPTLALTSLPAAAPLDAEALISHVEQQHSGQPSVVASVLAAVSKACWQILLPPERKKLATRQAGWVMSSFWKRGLAVSAKPLRLLRPCEMSAFLTEVDTVLARTHLSEAERCEARAMIAMGLLFGMRIEEVCRAFVGDLQEGGVFQIYGGKTAAARRAANIHLFGASPEAASLKAEVIAYIASQSGRPAHSTLWPALTAAYPRVGMQAAHGRRKIPSPDIMSQKFDDILDEAFRRFCEKNKRSPATDRSTDGAFTFHTLRHAVAIRLTQYAFDTHFWHGNFFTLIATISIQLGHICTQTTQGGYVGTAWVTLKMPPLPNGWCLSAGFGIGTQNNSNRFSHGWPFLALG